MAVYGHGWTVAGEAAWWSSVGCWLVEGAERAKGSNATRLSFSGLRERDLEALAFSLGICQA